MDTENMMNKELHEKLAEKFKEIWDRGDEVRTPNDAVFLEMAEHAVATLMPTAVNSELPNDSKLGSGRQPMSEEVKEDVGGLIDPSTPEETKSGERDSE